MAESRASVRVFAERLRATREDRGLSQAELADRAGMPPSAISHFETANRAPSFDNLRLLADALSVTIDFLVGREAKEAPSGPRTQQLFRQFSKLTDADQDTLTQFAKMLAKKGSDK